MGITGWELGFSLARSAINKSIVENIVRLVTLKQAHATGRDASFKLTGESEKILLGRIRSFYEGSKRKFYNTDMTEEDVILKKAKDARNSRKKEVNKYMYKIFIFYLLILKQSLQLRNKRLAAFHGNKAEITAEFGTEQECLTLLENKDYISDEEPLEFEHGYASSFKVLSPSWRSKKVQKN